MFPTKEQLEKKWWHRFFRVILVISTIIWAVILFFILGEGQMLNWQKTRYLYSFESDYDQYSGREENCYIGVNSSYVEVEKILGHAPPFPPTQVLQCGDLNLNTFISLYCLNKPSEPVCPNPNIQTPKPTGLGLTYEQLIQMGAKPVIITLEGIKLKHARYTDWSSVFGSLALLAGGIFGWVVLLKYGIYRTVLYVVFGSK